MFLNFCNLEKNLKLSNKYNKFQWFSRQVMKYIEVSFNPFLSLTGTFLFNNLNRQ